MPVSIDATLTDFSQQEFATIAYEVMGEVFALHNQMGRLFDEKVYQHALAARMRNIQSEVRIDLSFKNFSKYYFIDAIAAGGAVFELKAVDALNAQHRAQLLNYLLLIERKHGKLVNFRTPEVEHEFVNTNLTVNDRTSFAVDDAGWRSTPGFGKTEKSLVTELLRDWGTCLTRTLYEEALVCFFGGPERAYTAIDIWLDNTRVSQQNVILCGERTAFKCTTYEENSEAYGRELAQFLELTVLEAIQWVNIARDRLTFTTITRGC